MNYTCALCIETEMSPHLELSENCRSVIGDKQLLQVVDDHFVHTLKQDDFTD